MVSRKNTPSVASLLVLIIFVGILAFVLVAGLVTFWNAPNPNQVAARPVAVVTQTLEATLVPTLEPTLIQLPLPTETIIVFPTDPQPSPVIPPPPNTPHIPGPTAQFDKVLPIEEWSTHVDEQAGFSIKYPPDWYLEASPRELQSGSETIQLSGATIQFFSFDPEDPILDRKGGPPVPNFVKLEIIINDLQETGEPFLPGESIEDWVNRTRTYAPEIADQIRLIEQKNVMVGGIPSVLQVLQLKNNDRWNNHFFVPRDTEIMHIMHRQQTGIELFDQVFEQMVNSIEFLR